LRDFAGATVLDVPSHVSDRILAALGARPVHLDYGSARDRAIACHSLDGVLDSALMAPPTGVRVITANLILDPRFNVLVANSTAFASLSNNQRAAVRAAASQTVRHAVDTTPTEETAAASFCTSAGRVAISTPAERQALRLASQPVLAGLERNPKTASMIRRIRRLVTQFPPPTTFLPPKPCTRPLPTAPAGTARSPSILNGTYHWTVTRAEALSTLPRADWPDALPGLPAVNKIVLQDGRWAFPGSSDHAQGTYAIVGHYFIFRGSGGARPNMFTFARSGDGTLRLTPVLPMDPGDQFVMTGGGRSPWQRIGPPILDLG
jgi:hypothetical protein